MAEIDPVILRLVADNGRYKAELANTTRVAELNLGKQERAVVSLERQIKASSAQIGGHFRAMAGALAGALSARQVIAMADSYTRFTNQLRVAGLEGESLASVQQRLFAVAQQNGVQLEAIGTLYSRAAQNQKELGASTTDLIGLTRAVAASLKISGTSTQEASGALLQLGQALGSPRIQAEEFNSLLDTMQPLLREASKYIDGTGNSLSGLTRKIKDTKGEGVSNVQLFQAITKALGDLEKRAAGADLTISAAFTNLTSALTRYIGEADRANGASAMLAQAMQTLGNNIDTIADALGVIAVVLIGRYVSGLTVTTAATVAQGVATQRLAAQQAFLDAMIAKTTATNVVYGSSLVRTTTLLGTVGAASRAAGASMLAAFGGPIGIAIALGVAVVALVQAQDDSTASSRAQAAALEEVKPAIDADRVAIDKLASATGKARQEALEHVKALRAQRQEAIASARDVAKAAQVKLQAAKAELAARSGLVTGLSALSLLAGGPALAGENKVVEAQAGYDAAMAKVGALIDSFDALGGAISGPRLTPTSSPEKGDPKKKPRGRSGPTAQEIEQQHVDELRRIYAEQLQDELAVTTDIERRRDIQNELNRLEYEQRRAQVENDKNFTKAQKAAQIAALNKRFGGDAKLVDGEYVVGTPSFLGQAVNRDADERAARNRGQIARNEQNALQAEAELASNRLARLAIERAILEQREIEERAALDAAIAAGQIADAAQARATLEREQAARRTKLGRDYESPFQSYARRLGDQGANIDDEVESLVVQRLDEVDDAISDVISSRLGIKDPLIKSLLNLLIQQVLMKPIAEALAGASGGSSGSGFVAGASNAGYGIGFHELFRRIFGGGGSGGGILGTILGVGLGGLFGRASGGYVGPGQTVRVNEQRGGVELLRMGSQGGHVIPLGQANARAARPTGGITVIAPQQFDLRGVMMTEKVLAQMDQRNREYADAVGRASTEASLRGAPAAVAKSRRYGSNAF